MRCAHCGEPLPVHALFCGECGRAVGSVASSRKNASLVAPVPLAQEIRGWQVRVSTGQRFQVTGSALVGRRPRPAAGRHYDAILSIVDETRTVSKNHLELHFESGELFVTDLGSGNGTVLIAPEAGPVECSAGSRIKVPPGSRLELGLQHLQID